MVTCNQERARMRYVLTCQNRLSVRIPYVKAHGVYQVYSIALSAVQGIFKKFLRNVCLRKKLCIESKNVLHQNYILIPFVHKFFEVAS